MRTRVASIVTLLTLVLLGFLLIQSCSILAKEENRDYRDTLYLACQAAGATLEEENSEGRQAGLKAMKLRDEEIVAGIYSADGSVLFATNGNETALTDDDFVKVKPDSINVYTRKNAEGKEAYYAIYQFDDGGFLLFSRTASTGWGILFENELFLLAAGLWSYSWYTYCSCSTTWTARKKSPVASWLRWMIFPKAGLIRASSRLPARNRMRRYITPSSAASRIACRSRPAAIML